MSPNASMRADGDDDAMDVEENVPQLEEVAEPMAVDNPEEGDASQSEGEMVEGDDQDNEEGGEEGEEWDAMHLD